jgi:26S proteasome regulatory subunit N1
MTISEKRECLKYRFLSSKELVGSWGHEYVRHLTAELTQEWSNIENASKEATTATTTSTDTTITTTTTTDPTNNTVTQTQDVEFTVEPTIVITKEDLLKLSKEIVDLYMKHNAEADACDLLMEIENVEILIDYVEKDTYQRVCLYLLG